MAFFISFLDSLYLVLLGCLLLGCGVDVQSYHVGMGPLHLVDLLLNPVSLVFEVVPGLALRNVTKLEAQVAL